MSREEPPYEFVLQPMSIGVSVAIFGVATVAMCAALYWAIPALMRLTNMPMIVCWFLAAGSLVLGPLFFAALLCCRWEGAAPSWRVLLARLRLQRMTAGDWLWTIGATLVSVAATAGIVAAFRYFAPDFRADLPEMRFGPLAPGEYWILLAWPPFLFFNIFGEELMWRGYMMPRQEAAHGRATWIVQAVLWSLFHVPFGWSVLLFASPLLIVLPYVVQRRRNTWIGIVMHGLFGVAGFLSKCFGLA